MNTRADSAASTKGELIPLGRVRVRGAVGQRKLVVHVPLGFKLAGLRRADGVVVDGPGVVDDARVGGDEVAVVVVVLRDGVRDGAHDGRGHPAERFLDDGADVLQGRLVVHGGQAVGADDAVDFLLGFALDFGVQKHGLDETVESGGGGVGAGFEKRAGDVGGLVVGETFLLLDGDEILAEAVRDFAGERVLLGFQPVAFVKSKLLLVQLLGLLAGREKEIGQVAQEGEEVDQGGHAGLVNLGELGEAVKELLHLLVVVGGRAPAVDHGGGERVGVAADVVQELVGLGEHLVQHLLVLEHLVRDVGLGGRDVEERVRQLAAHAPARSVAHHENAQVARAERLANVHLLAVRVHVALLVEKVLDGPVTRENDHDLGSEDETVDGAIFASPLFELKMNIFRWHLSSKCLC